MSRTTAAMPAGSGAERRRVALATVVGTTIEWYDFFIYAMGAALVFDRLFFAPAGHHGSVLLSFATIGLSFLFRPLGAALAGHFGDRFGRRPLLVATLTLMGMATMLIGVLPTHAQIGLLAPLLLVLLRIIQGLSAGGEWGGAALLAVEHAPVDRRGRFGALPQIGVPLGLLLSSGVMALVTGLTSREQFEAWGWRLPFLLSVVLLAIGFYVRWKVAESPVFEALRERREDARMPLGRVLGRQGWLVLLAALTFAGNNAAGYMTTGGFVQRYATDPAGPVHLPRTEVLWIVTASAIVWLIATLLAGDLSDRIGRKPTYLIGWVCQLLMVFPLFWLVERASPGYLFLALALFSIGLGLTYGPQAAFFAELFPADVRYSGVALSYALGAVIGGAFSPMIAQALIERTGTTASVSAYLMVMTVIALVATAVLPSRDRVGLGGSGRDPTDPGDRGGGAARGA